MPTKTRQKPMTASNLPPVIIYDFRVMAWLVYNHYEAIDWATIASQKLSFECQENNPIKLLEILQANTDPTLTRKWLQLQIDLQAQYVKAAWALVCNRGPNATSYQPHVAVFADDNGIDTPYWRKQLFPSYKSSRRQKPDELNSIAQQGLHYICDPKSPFVYLQKPGYEADDFAGALVKIKRLCQAYLKRNYQVDDKVALIANRDIWLYTVDSDWLQLVGDGVTWYNSGPWEPRIRGPVEAIEWAKKRLKVDLTSPEQIVNAKMRLGDKSDDLPEDSPRYLIDLMNVHPDWELSKVCPSTYNKLWHSLCIQEPNQNLEHYEKARAWFLSNSVPMPV